MEPLRVSGAEAGQKLLNFLLRRVTATQPEIQRWLRTGQVRLNKGRCKAFVRVEEGDEVRIPPFATVRPVAAEALAPGREDSWPLMSERCFPPVLHEDDHVLVVNKPAGLAVQGGTGQTDSLAAMLGRRYVGHRFIPAPAHRLDKATSGLVAIGKSYAALRFLTDALAGRSEARIVKDYVAWVWGNCPWDAPMALTDSLFKSSEEQRVRVERRPKEGGREARSLVRVLERRTLGEVAISLVLVRLLTGRTHQIRVQLAARGFPLAGDGKYGAPDKDAWRRPPVLMLHATRLWLPEAPFMSAGEAGLLVEAPAPWKTPWAVQAALPSLERETPL